MIDSLPVLKSASPTVSVITMGLCSRLAGSDKS